MLEMNKLYNMDCMEGMKQFPDKYFDLAIVDPPYGGAATQESAVASQSMTRLAGGHRTAGKRRVAPVSEASLTNTR